MQEADSVQQPCYEGDIIIFNLILLGIVHHLVAGPSISTEVDVQFIAVPLPPVVSASAGR